MTPTDDSDSIGTLDATGCLVQAAPWGTHAFGYDGANRYIMKPPPGTTAFIYNDAFYYGE